MCYISAVDKKIHTHTFPHSNYKLWVVIDLQKDHFAPEKGRDTYEERTLSELHLPFQMQRLHWTQITNF